ncbi:MAG: hypothetical protein AB1736_00540 [Chloroflexota bacterium]
MREAVQAVRLGAMLAIALASLGCATERHSEIVIGADGLRTFTVFREVDGAPVACPAFAVVDPVRGILEGAVGAREPVWLRNAPGRQLSVVWPEGFSVRFEPEAALYNEGGRVVARQGQAVELGQVGWDENAGTFEDPYIASGILFDGCYPFP